MNSSQQQPLLGLWPQIGFLALFCGTLHCVLWMQGDARITVVSTLLATACLTLSRLSYRVFPRWMRVMLQCALVLMGFLWLLKRWEQVPMDICVCEGACLLLCSLFLARTLPDHLLLWGACIALLAYGSMNATRPYFLLFFAFGALFGALQLYTTRTLVLAQGRNSSTALPENPSGFTLYWLPHLAIALALTFFLTTHFTHLPQWNTMGLVPTSFRSMQSQNFPGNFQEWFTTSNQYQESYNGELLPGEAHAGNPLLDPNAAALINVPDAPATSSAGAGSGLAIGKDLVFQAYSTAKLYWLLQTYDQFDGTTWSRSEELEHAVPFFDYALPDRFATVVQKITLYKPASDFLPFAYAPRWLRYSSAVNGAAAQREEEAIIRNEGYLQYRLSKPASQSYPALPWHYTVVSNVALPPEEIGDPAQLPPRPNDAHAWPPTRPPDARGYHFPYMHFTNDTPSGRFRPRGFDPDALKDVYLQLPDSAVTPRMKRLAKDLTKDAQTDLEKATALRNFLRENFTYSLQPPTATENVPPLDYFLFESKTGFCQHFAQALVFLARAAGLRSRLATGYAPGNYNILKNCYEIYEYHAHAWTQIFVERYGWLTFDGTPPGALDLHNTPQLLAATRNAFDETWTPSIPELALKPQPGTPVFSRANPNGWSRSGAPQNSTSGLPGLLQSLGYTPAAAAPPEDGGANLTASKVSLLGKLGEMTEKTSDLLGSLGERIGALFDKWEVTPVRSTAALLAAVTLVVFAWLLRYPVVARFRRLYHKFLCRKDFKYLRNLPREATKLRIETSLALADRTLSYCNLPRTPGSDAIEYAQTLASSAPVFHTDFLSIAQAALQNHFAPEIPAEMADSAETAASRLLQSAYPLIQ